MPTRLRIAIQKSGRLYDDSLQLLKDCGIDLKNGINKLKTEADNFPMEVFFLRDDDIPQYVEDAVADIGIVGENVVYEKSKSVEVVKELGVGKCSLAAARPRAVEFQGVGFLNGKRFPSSYPNLVNQYLQQNKILAEI